MELYVVLKTELVENQVFTDAVGVFDDIDSATKVVDENNDSEIYFYEIKPLTLNTLEVNPEEVSFQID